MRFLLLLTLISTVTSAPQYTTRSLDYTEVCSKMAHFYQKYGGYCSHFDKTCSELFESKGVCKTMQLNSCKKCVLHDCREYAGKVRPLPPPEIRSGPYIPSGLTQLEWENLRDLNGRKVSEFFDHTGFAEGAARNIINGTSYCGRFEFSCWRSMEQLQREHGNVCRLEGAMCVTDPDDEQKGKGNCQFEKCSKSTESAEAVIEAMTVRKTAVSEMDIDETRYAIGYALLIADNTKFHGNMNYCYWFYKGCEWCRIYDSAEQDKNYKIKEKYCIPQRTGWPAKGSCILVEE